MGLTEGLRLANEARDLVAHDPNAAVARYHTAIEALGATGGDNDVETYEAAIEAHLDRPAERLVVYGTLAPGEVNHHLVQDLGGEWFDARVRGTRDTHRGLPAFRVDPDAPPVAVLLLRSERLPWAYASYLDDFEGQPWPRHLVEADTDDLGPLVASIYEFVG